MEEKIGGGSPTAALRRRRSDGGGEEIEKRAPNPSRLTDVIIVENKKND